MEKDSNLIPPPGSGRPRKYDFSELKEYGDSVFIPAVTPYDIHVARDAAYKYAKTEGIKVVTRKESSGVRVYHAGQV